MNLIRKILGRIHLSGLDIYDSSKKEYVYTVREKEEIEGYFQTEILRTDNTFTIVNTKTGSIEINVNELISNEKLKGATFIIERKNGESDWIQIGEYISDSNGNIFVDNLTYGTYKITEIRAPDGYNLNSENAEVEIEITETNAMYELTVSHKAKTVLPKTGGGTVQLILLIIAVTILILPDRFKIKRFIRK